MNDNEATRLLDRAAEALIPDEPAPLSSLLSAAKQGQRQRSRRSMTMAAASVALVLGGGAVVQQVTDPGNPPPDKPSQNLTSDVPTAPDGKVLVGMGQVVVAVPDSWARLPNGCHIPRGNVYFEPVHAQDCWMGSYSSSGRTQPTLGFSALGDTDLTAFEPLEVVNGALLSEANCNISGDRDCRERIALPDLKVLLTLRWDVADGAAAIAGEVRDSLQLLPEGYTTVPFVAPGTQNGPAGNQLMDAGLKHELDVDLKLGTGRQPVSGTSPEAGSVVEMGSTVTLLVQEPAEPGSGPDMTGTPSTSRPGDVVSLDFPTALDRGIGFTLIGPDCTSAACVPQQTYYLTSDSAGGEPAWSDEGMAWNDIGVGGLGPDHVVIPEVAADGTYQLCTANAAKEMCAQVEVSDRAAPTIIDGPTIDDGTLNALAITLLVEEPLPNGKLPTRVRVQNLSGSPVVETNCGLANYLAGVTSRSDPATFIGSSTTQTTRCAGPRTLPPGYEDTSEGPTLRVTDLDPGTYLAVIDYGETRSELLTSEFTIEPFEWGSGAES